MQSMDFYDNRLSDLTLAELKATRFEPHLMRARRKKSAQAMRNDPTGEEEEESLIKGSSHAG